MSDGFCKFLKLFKKLKNFKNKTLTLLAYRSGARTFSVGQR